MQFARLLHGGLISALSDNAMGLSCMAVFGSRGETQIKSMVTVSLHVDFLGQAKIGQWLAFDTHYVKIGKTLNFANAFVTADGEIIARAAATFRGSRWRRRIEARIMQSQLHACLGDRNAAVSAPRRRIVRLSCRTDSAYSAAALNAGAAAFTSASTWLSYFEKFLLNMSTRANAVAS